MGMDLNEATETMNQYNERLPFVHWSADWFTRRAADRGFIQLIDGARGHFNLCEPITRDFAKETNAKKVNPNIDTFPCFEEEYLRRKNDDKHPWYGERMKRAFTHKAFNRMIQGSAARQIKKAMVEIHRAGYSPLLQMHDELAFSFSSKDAGNICSKIMENVMSNITVPMLTDVEWGPNWGALKK